MTHDPLTKMRAAAMVVPHTWAGHSHNERAERMGSAAFADVMGERDVLAGLVKCEREGCWKYDDATPCGDCALEETP